MKTEREAAAWTFDFLIDRIQKFDQIPPTDQVAALQVHYDPKTLEVKDPLS
jgi:hypothetical protein